MVLTGRQTGTSRASKTQGYLLSRTRFFIAIRMDVSGPSTLQGNLFVLFSLFQVSRQRGLPGLSK
jgi:hypothetical protein